MIYRSTGQKIHKTQHSINLNDTPISNTTHTWNYSSVTQPKFYHVYFDKKSVDVHWLELEIVHMNKLELKTEKKICVRKCCCFFSLIVRFIA